VIFDNLNNNHNSFIDNNQLIIYFISYMTVMKCIYLNLKYFFYNFNLGQVNIIISLKLIVSNYTKYTIILCLYSFKYLVKLV